MLYNLFEFYFIFWLIVLGAVAGSFLDCMVSRWIEGKSLVKGRSQCANCGNTLSPIELVPIISYLAFKGKCCHCGAKIPFECVLAEIAGAIAFAFVGLKFGISLELFKWIVFTALLLPLSIVDIKKHIIPDKIVLLMALNRVVWFFILGEPFLDTINTILISFCMPALLLLVVLAMDKITGKETMGGGDIKLLMVMSMYLDWTQILLTLFLGSVTGILAFFIKKDYSNGIAFGPFLALGCVLTVCFGGNFIKWYLSLFM